MTRTNIQNQPLSSLVDELLSLGKSLMALGNKFKLVTSQNLEPELFDKRLVSKLRNSRAEFAKGQKTSYLELRKTFKQTYS